MDEYGEAKIALEDMKKTVEEAAELANQINKLFLGKNFRVIALALHIASEVIEDLKPGIFDMVRQLTPSFREILKKSKFNK